MKAKDYRARARQSLSGKWGLAVGATFVASLLGGVNSGQVSVNFDLPSDDLEYYLGDSAYFSQSVDESMNIDPAAMEGMLETFFDVFAVVGFISTVFAIVAFILGGATKAGLCRLNKNLYYGTEPKFNDIFMHYNKLGNTIVANLLIAIFTVLWTLLFIIPGIIASYSYRMTFYILDENPDMSAKEAIKASKELMKGHKWQLFCLDISFIGWAIVTAFTLGFGVLFLNPYTLAAEYAFYNQIANGGETPEEYSGEPQVTGEIVDVPVEEAPVVEA